MRALLIEPFYGGSHAAFADGWMARSRHRWERLTLPAEGWKWRMRHAGSTLGESLARRRSVPQVIVVSALCDLAHLRSAAGPRFSRCRWLVYWHENQLDYPRPAGKPFEWGFHATHRATLIAGDGHAFNSRAHLAAFQHALASWQQRVPALARVSVPRGWRARARVVAPGVDFSGFPEPGQRPLGIGRQPGEAASGVPRVLWNHRWEEDKRPSAFARTITKLADKGLPFTLVLLGLVDQVHPQPLLGLRRDLPARIERDGPARSRREYIAWLARCDLTLSTAEHENFGYAVLEAMAAGAVPLLPRRLSYPEVVPRRLHEALLYDSDRDLAARLARWLQQPEQFTALRPAVMRAARRHAWERRIAALDDWVAGA